MSRETDRSPSGPQGQGHGGAYPQGAQPYGPGAGGSSVDPDEAAGADPNAKGRSGDRKTETTLTTRIRINIPGSRPIPPVVMRKPVAEADNANNADHADTGSDAQPVTPEEAPSSPLPGPRSGEAGGDAQSGEFTAQTSDWFAPRKGKPNSGTSAGTPGASGAGGSGGAAAAPRPGEAVYGGDDPYGVANPYGVSEIYNQGTDPLGPGSSPYGTGDPADGASRPGPDAADAPPRAPRPMEHPDGAGASPASGGMSGPTTGPARGDMPLPQRPVGGSGRTGPPPPATPTPGLGAGPGAPSFAGERAGLRDPGAPAPGDPGAPNPDVLAGPAGAPHFPPAASRDGSGDLGGPSERAAGDTLTGRAPRTSSEASSPPAAPQFPAAADDEDADEKTARGGRKMLVLAGVAVLGAAGIAYGAGLLLDHADVPNGTVVLGVDIGGASRHDAVNKLDAAFGDRATQPFDIAANGQRAKLKPSVAGLTLDTEATVRNAAGRDYNPVTVIGSLFGAERVAQPALKVDEEKMASALETLSRQTGDGGAPKDGMVKFVRGKAVAIPGKPHKGIDPDKASAALQKAYRNRAETGDNSPVRLPVTLQQPKIGKKELNRAIEEFGRPAMSGLVTIKAGNASIQFSPEKSLPKFVSMKPVNGTLVDTYDLPVLKSLYGTTFDGVKITRGDGSRTPVTPQDVAGALRQALKETTPAGRVQRIPLEPQ